MYSNSLQIDKANSHSPDIQISDFHDNRDNFVSKDVSVCQTRRTVRTEQTNLKHITTEHPTQINTHPSLAS